MFGYTIYGIDASRSDTLQAVPPPAQPPMIKQTGDDLVDVMETSRKSASRELDAYIEQFDGRSSGRSSSAHSTTLVEEEDDDGSRSVPVLNLPDNRRLPASWQHRSDIRAEWRRLLDEIHSNVELGAQPEQIVTTASIHHRQERQALRHCRHRHHLSYRPTTIALAIGIDESFDAGEGHLASAVLIHNLLGGFASDTQAANDLLVGSSRCSVTNGVSL